MSALSLSLVPSLPTLLLSPRPPLSTFSHPPRRRKRRVGRTVRLAVGLGLNAVGLVLCWQGLVPSGGLA